MPKASIVATSSQFSNVANISSTTPLLLNMPAGVQEGQWVMVVFTYMSLSGESYQYHVKPVDDVAWKRLFGRTGDTDATHYGTMTWVAYYAQYSPSLNRNFTSNNSSLRRMLPVCLAFADAPDPATWVVGQVCDRVTFGTSTTTVATGVTPPGDDYLIMGFFGERTAAAEADVASVVGATKLGFFGPSDNNPDTTLVITTEDGVKDTNSGSTTVTYSNPQTSNAVGLQLMIPPGGTIVVEPEPTPLVKAWAITNTGPKEGDLYYQTANGPKGVEQIWHLPPGYDTVAQMKAQPRFFIAHRGGSQWYPEMTLHAYTQSVAWGFPALEVSLGRTSDGVWVGHHDETIDRVTGIASGLRIGAYTWSEIQAMQVLSSTATQNPGQPNRPFMRWEEIAERYATTHVLFVDLKYEVGTTAYRNEFYLMLNDIPNSQQHIVFKYFGVLGAANNSTGMPIEVANMGYSRWGYFYETDLPNLATYQGRWDLLGAPYNAAQSFWDELLTYNKPIIGHICPSQAAVDTAFAKGASGVMVSGVGAVNPDPVIR